MQVIDDETFNRIHVIHFHSLLYFQCDTEGALNERDASTKTQRTERERERHDEHMGRGQLVSELIKVKQTEKHFKVADCSLPADE